MRRDTTGADALGLPAACRHAKGEDTSESSRPLASVHFDADK